MKSIKTEEFFRLVAVNSGISDLDVIKRVFYGMVRTITRELRDKQIVKLPDFGEFVLVIHKSRKYKTTKTHENIILPPKPTVKFRPDWKVKQYFYELK